MSAPSFPVRLKLERVSRLNTPADALPGIRSPQLHINAQDLTEHRIQHDQLLFICEEISSKSSSASPSPSPWLLVQAVCQAGVTSGSARLHALSPSPVAWQAGTVIALHPLPAPVLPASTIALRRTTAATSTSAQQSPFQASIDAFVRHSLSQTQALTPQQRA